MDGHDRRGLTNRTAPTVCVSLFGVFDIASSDGRTIDVPSTKAKALLAYLVSTPGMRHSREHLATLLWDRSDQEHARASLRQAIAALRKSFTPHEKFYLISEDVEIVALNPQFFSSDINQLTAGESNPPEAEAFLASLSVNAEPFEDWRRAQICKFSKIFETPGLVSIQETSPTSTSGHPKFHKKAGLPISPLFLVGGLALVVGVTLFSMRIEADAEPTLHGQNALEITRQTAVLKTHPELRNEISSCRYDNGDSDTVISACTKIIDALANDEPYKSIALTIRGTAYRWKTDHAKAVEDFAKALVIDPSYYNAHHGLGYTYYLTRRFPDALLHYQRVREINPLHFMALYRSGEVYLEMGDNINAVDIFNQVIEENDGYAHAYFNRAKAYMALGKTNDAKRDLMKAAAFNSALRSEAEMLYAQLPG